MSTIKYAYLVAASLLAVVGWTSNAPTAAQTAPTDPLTAKTGTKTKVKSGQAHTKISNIKKPVLKPKATEPVKIDDSKKVQQFLNGKRKSLKGYDAESGEIIDKK